MLFDDWQTGTLRFNTGKVGAPDLPTVSTLLFVPMGSTLEVRNFEIGEYHWKEMVHTDMPLAPAIRAWSKEQGWPGYEPNEKIYATDAFYRGGDPIEIENLGVMGTEQVFRVTLRPVAYNPVSGDLLVDTAITALFVSKLNSNSYPQAANRFLIVSRPEFESGLQPFVQWKRQEGYDVEELYVNTHQRDSIKEQIRPYFDNASLLEPAPSYILLVGDAAQLQSFPGETSLEGEGHTTDLYYSEFTGDYLPEAMMGRWPVNDTAELRAVVEKTIRYEQFVWMDTAQLKRILLVAGSESNIPAPTTTNGQVNYVSQEVKLTHPEMDTLCYHNPQSGTMLDSIVADIGRGAGLLNYTAHCTVGGWTSPALSIGGVEEASATQPMVYVNNCCKSNTFSGTGFGEQLLRLPVGGGVGVIGATNSTLWYEDYYWAVGPKYPISLTATYDSLAIGAFDALVGRHHFITTVGEMLSLGNLAVTEQGSGYAKFYWEIYCLLGDPTLRPWIGVPQPIDLEVLLSPSNGESELYLSGTIGATVTAMQGNEVIGSTVINASGSALLQLNRALDTLPLVLTSTGAGLWPRLDTLPVEADIAFGAALRNVSVGDTLVSCVVENVGHQRIDSLVVFLTQAGADALSSALLEEQQVFIDSLLPGEHLPVLLPIHVSTIGALPLWKASLIVWKNGEGDLCRLTLRHGISVTYPTLSPRLLDDRNREARRVLPGHNYRLETTTNGVGDSLRLYAKASPSNDDWSTPDSSLAFTTPDSLCALGIGATAYLGNYQGEQYYWLEPGNRKESFEHGFDSHPWQNSSRSAWVLDSTESHSGHYSLRSGSIGHSQQTKVCLEVEMMLRDTISYWVKTSTEAQHDKMVFSVDGRDFTPAAWGIDGWRQRIHVLDPGHHSLCWRYSKDVSDSEGEDCVWIDDIQIPLALWDTTYTWDCINATVGIDNSPLPASLTLYPNPATGLVWIEGPQDTEVRISDIMGRTLDSFIIRDCVPELWDASALQAGVYFATSNHDGHRITQKIIIIKQ